VKDPLIPVADIRAAQNKRLELLGLNPVSETEYENMHHHSGDDFMTEYHYNRRGLTDRAVGTVTEWGRVGKSVKATKREVGMLHPTTLSDRHRALPADQLFVELLRRPYLTGLDGLFTVRASRLAHPRPFP
jgi:hypothetical protein